MRSVLLQMTPCIRVLVDSSPLSRAARLAAESGKESIQVSKAYSKSSISDSKLMQMRVSKEWQ